MLISLIYFLRVRRILKQLVEEGEENASDSLKWSEAHINEGLQPRNKRPVKIPKNNTDLYFIAKSR